MHQTDWRTSPVCTHACPNREVCSVKQLLAYALQMDAQHFHASWHGLEQAMQLQRAHKLQFLQRAGN